MSCTLRRTACLAVAIEIDFYCVRNGYRQRFKAVRLSDRWCCVIDRPDRWQDKVQTRKRVVEDGIPYLGQLIEVDRLF